MIVQNNPTPWVVLTLLVMTGCAVSGMMLGNVGPFNSHMVQAQISIQQTQGALDSAATQAAAAVSLTQQAPSIQQTAVVGEMTTVPLQQTATQMAVANAVQASEANATQTAISGQAQNYQLMAQANQTAIANNLYIQGIASNATATAIVRSQAMEQVTGIAGLSIVGIGLLVLLGWILARAITQVIVAHAQEQAARAQLLEAQRQLIIERANQQAQRKAAHSQYPLPLSLIKKTNEYKDLPRAE